MYTSTANSILDLLQQTQTSHQPFIVLYIYIYMLHRLRQRVLPHLALFNHHHHHHRPVTHHMIQMEARHTKQVKNSSRNGLRHSPVVGERKGVVVVHQNLPPTGAHETIGRVFFVLSKGTHLNKETERAIKYEDT